MGDNVIVDTVFDGDCQPQRREQLACSYAASRCSTGEVIQLIAESEITFLSSVQYTTTEKTDANVIQGRGSIASLYSMLLELFSQRFNRHIRSSGGSANT